MLKQTLVAINLFNSIKKDKVKPLSSWEEGFLKSIELQIANKQEISFKQGSTLQKIYRKCAGGLGLRFK